jgi:ABC-2 type transport system permease protein
MSAMSAKRSAGSRIVLVLVREIGQRLRSKAFLVSTALLVIVVLAGGVANRLLSGDDAEPVDVAVIGDAPAGLDAAIRSTRDLLDVELRLRLLPDAGEAALESALRDGTVDAVVVVEGSGSDRTGTIVTVEEAATEIVTALDLAWRSASAGEAAAAAGLTEAETLAILQPAPLETNTLEPPDDDRDDDPLALLVGMVVAVVLFLSISFYGSAVLTGVVEEKSTGVIEVLLAYLRPHQLLIGKVLGIATVALLQFVATVVAGVASLAISGQQVPAEVWFALPTALGWFLGGFLFYTTLFALAGSFVSRQEDAQGASAPVTVVMTVAYFLVFTIGTDPSSPATRVLSVLPPFSPMLMPLRIATGSASVLEIVLAAVALAAGIYGMLRLTGAVYGRTLLHRGSRLSWRAAVSMVRRP